MRLFSVLLGAIAAGAEQVVFDPTAPTHHVPLIPMEAPLLDSPTRQVSIQVPLAAYYNNKASSNGKPYGVGMHNGSTYPAENLPKCKWTHEGVEFDFPNWTEVERDNVRADGEKIALPLSAELNSVHLVAAGEGSGGFNLGNTMEKLGLVYEDGTEDSVDFVVKTWWAHHWTNKGAIRSSFQYSPTGDKVYNASHIFHTAVAMPPSAAGKKVSGLILPKQREHNNAHIFAISCVPVMSGSTVQERAIPAFVRATRRWDDLKDNEADTASDRAQVVEVAIRNPLSTSRHLDRSTWIDRPLSISLLGDAFTTVRAGYIPRLMPGDEVIVEILVKPTGKSSEFTNAHVEFTLGDSHWTRPVQVEGSKLVFDFGEWSSDDADTEQHTSPAWFNNAKFGIFIHWGLFSVPAWAPVPRYAEWYDFWIHDDKPGMPAYEHHLNTYGPDFVYDDFIPMFTAENFNASAWVDLFADAGAKYFVFTTKHHDGYALFDTKETSDRNSLKMGPKRDFLRELMDTAEKEQPHLKRGTYFSMPEWFNPLYKKHGRVSFPGGPAINPYKPGEVEPYNGFVDVGEYVSGLQVPQMKILAEDYKTELIWCDIGLDNDSSTFVSEWYAQAAAEGRQVAISNRCGIGGDFDTPEMEKFDAVELHKWETCASMDPFSFGYSADTKDDEYRNATDVIHTLVDITAKGGNFLLNVGPKADGTIIEAMAKPLREAGAWLRVNARAIYDTFPFPLLPEVHTEDVHVEFTRTSHSLNIISLKDLGEKLVIKAPLPILDCDKIVFVTQAEDVRVPYIYTDGVLTVDVSSIDDSERTGGLAYVLEVQYKQCE